MGEFLQLCRYLTDNIQRVHPQLDDAADGVVVECAVALDAGVDDGVVVDVGVVDGGAGAGVAAGDVPRFGRLRSPSPQNRVQRRHFDWISCCSCRLLSLSSSYCNP